MVEKLSRESLEETDHLLGRNERSATKASTSLQRLCQSMDLKQRLQQISVPVYILVMLFAIASWIDISGLWVELPLLVDELPEAWSLPSYLVIIIQIANIGPLLYTITHQCVPHHVKDWPVVYIIIFIGAVACLLLALFWDHTNIILGAERSVTLIILSTFLALVDCTSSVVFLPFMATFKPQYMSAFYIGEGLSGLIPGIVGLIQGMGSDPHCENSSVVIHNATMGGNIIIFELVPTYKPPQFSVEVFFFFLFCMLAASGVAFTCLNFTEFCQKETVSTEIDYFGYEKPIPASEDHGAFGPDYEEGIQYDAEFHSKVQVLCTDKPGHLTTYHFAFLLGVTAWINGLTNGVLPSTQSYSSLPYSNRVYTLSVRLSTLANPLACFAALFLPTESLNIVVVLTVLGTGFAGYQLYLAALSPVPVLLGHWSGDFLAVSTSVLLTGLFSYVRVTVASLFRHRGRSALLWCGGITQVGSFVGAIITFILVNVLKVFIAGHAVPCPT